MTVYITYEMLRHAGACDEQRNLFRKMFPDGVEVTEELCVKHVHDFDFMWAADELLSGSAPPVFEEAVESARREYQKAGASAWQSYSRALASARYEEAVAPARREYQKAMESARRAYEEARARAFARAAALEHQTEE